MEPIYPPTPPTSSPLLLRCLLITVRLWSYCWSVMTNVFKTAQLWRRPCEHPLTPYCKLGESCFSLHFNHSRTGCVSFLSQESIRHTREKALWRASWFFAFSTKTQSWDNSIIHSQPWEKTKSAKQNHFGSHFHFKLCFGETACL